MGNSALHRAAHAVRLFADLLQSKYSFPGRSKLLLLIPLFKPWWHSLRNQALPFDLLPTPIMDSSSDTTEKKVSHALVDLSDVDIAAKLDSDAPLDPQVAARLR